MPAGSSVIKSLADALASAGLYESCKSLFGQLMTCKQAEIGAVLAGAAGGPITFALVLGGGALLEWRKGQRSAKELQGHFASIHARLSAIESGLVDQSDYIALLDELIAAKGAVPTPALAGTHTKDEFADALASLFVPAFKDAGLGDKLTWLRALPEAVIESRDNTRRILSVQERDSEKIDQLARFMLLERPAMQAEIESLRERLTSAIEAKIEAEAKLGKSIDDTIVELRRDPDALLRFLDQQVNDDEAKLIEHHRERAAVAYIRGDIHRCEQSVAKVLALLPDDDHSLNLKGNLQRIRGRYSEARDTFAHMLEVARDQHSKAVARGGHALMEWRCQNLDNAVSEMTMAAEEFSDLNDSIGVAYCHGNISAIELQRGNLTLAEEHLEKCLQECVKRGDLAGQATSYMNLGIIALRRAQYSRADDLNKMAIELARRSESAERVASCLVNQAAFYIETEQYHLAKPLIRESRDLCCELENDQGLMYCDHQLAVIAWRERRIRDAEVLLDSVERFNAEVKDHEMEANCLAERGHIAWSRLEYATARQLWYDAKGKFKAIQMTHEAQVVEGWLLQLPIE